MENNTHTETIKCPDCGTIQEATVEHTEPWFSYVHECVKCSYKILESEWSEVKPEPQVFEPVKLGPSAKFYTAENMFAPRMMVVDVREWDSLQKELEELRAFKNNSLSTYPFIQQILSISHETIQDVSKWIDSLSEAEKIIVMDSYFNLRKSLQEANHSATFDAPTEYGRKERITSTTSSFADDFIANRDLFASEKRLFKNPPSLESSEIPVDWKSIVDSGKTIVDENGATIEFQSGLYIVCPKSGAGYGTGWEGALNFMNKSKGWKIKD